MAARRQWKAKSRNSSSSHTEPHALTLSSPLAKPKQSHNGQVSPISNDEQKGGVGCPVQHQKQGKTKKDMSPSAGCPMAHGKAVRPKRGPEPVYYHSYLKLDQLLSAQQPLSLAIGKNLADDELLFIITHQAYELWFKQILFELDRCLGTFAEKLPLPEKAMSSIVHRLGRVTKILRQLVDQFDILETMSPMAFLDFREYLFPASGFQSLQFRLVENKLGLSRAKRLNYQRQPYTGAFKPEHKALAEESEKESLFNSVEKWLERTPFLKHDKFDFWQEYQACVAKMFQEDLNDIDSNAGLSAEEKEARVADIQHTKDVFNEFFDEKRYTEAHQSGRRRLSYGATKAAIMINLYREEPIFQLPYQLLTLLLEIDKLLTSWRTRHAIMVHRMLGMKMGTGGSSGYNYLRATISAHKIYEDLANLSMFLLPHVSIPKLPQHVLQSLRFRSDSVDDDQ